MCQKFSGRRLDLVKAIHPDKLSKHRGKAFQFFEQKKQSRKTRAHLRY